MPKGKSKRNAGKRRWKRQKHQNQLTNHQFEELKNEIQRDGFDHLPTANVSQDVTSMFKIDTLPENERKAKLDPTRFQKKKHRPMAKIDQKKVDKMLKYGIPEEPKPNKDGLYDLWGSNTSKPLKSKPVHIETKKTYNIPVLLKPHSGQSINPSLAAQKDLMQTIVNQVEIKRKDHGPKKVIPIAPKKVIPKTKKQAEEFRKLEAQKRAKEKEIDSRNAGKYMREAIKYATIDHPKILEARKKKIEERKAKMSSGEMLPTKRYLGKRTYEARAMDFKELDEIDPKASHVENTNEALREQFDSIYRRGLLEPRNLKRKKRRHHLPPIKYHNDPNRVHRERQRGINDTFGIIGNVKR